MSGRERIDFRQEGFATYYDELPLWSAPFGQMLLEVVPLRRGLRILEIGPGTGYLSIELAQRCGADSRVTAVDPWTEGLTRFRAKMEALGLENVDIVEADAADVDLPSETFDLIVSSLGVNNFDDPDGVLRNCFRMARPGAVLVLTSNLEGHMRELYDELRATLVSLGLSEALPRLQAHEERRGTVESLSQRLQAAGFSVGRVDSGTFHIRFADGTTLLDHYLIRLGFLDDWLALAPAPRADEVLEGLEQRLNALAARQGELSLTIPMACLLATRPASEARASGS